MQTTITKFNDFNINENVNDILIKAKSDVNKKQEEISNEVLKQKEADSIQDKASSIKKQAVLYSQMSSLLNKLAIAMLAKESSGDKTNIY